MPKTFRNPRMIAEAKNRGEHFSTDGEKYDAEAGTPPGVAPQRSEREYAANPTNPPEKPSCAKNLKR